MLRCCPPFRSPARAASKTLPETTRSNCATRLGKALIQAVSGAGNTIPGIVPARSEWLVMRRGKAVSFLFAGPILLAWRLLERNCADVTAVIVFAFMSRTAEAEKFRLVGIGAQGEVLYLPNAGA